MMNIIASRATTLALAATLALGSFTSVGATAADARSMPYNPAPITAFTPFKAFSGQGAGWAIKIRSHGGGDNSVSMTMRDGRVWHGTLRYNGPVMDASSRFTVMSGELRSGMAMLPITVEIAPDKACKGFGKKAKTSITVYGVDQQPMRGCGKIGR